MKRVLVTGANGFVGQHLSRELVSKGWCVRAAIRRPDAARDIPIGVEITQVRNLQSEDEWVRSLSQVDAVVHLVGRTHVVNEEATDPLLAYRAVNVHGTKAVVSASLRAGVKRFVYLSSIKAVGEGAPIPYTETAPCQPEDAYGITKLEAEQLLWKMCMGTPMEIVILRPPLVFGEGVKGNFLRLLQAIERGIPLPFKSVRNKRNMIYVRNLTSAIITALEHPLAANQVFHVADSVALSTPELIERIAKLMNRPVRLIACPQKLIHLGASILGRNTDVNRLTKSLTVCSQKISRQLNWTAPYSFETGLSNTVAWFLEHSSRRCVN